MRALLWICLGAMFAGSSLNAQDAAKSANKTTQTPGAATRDLSYKIGRDDERGIDVWKEPWISRSVAVRPDGKDSLPFLNDVHAAGLTAMELENVITEGVKNFMNCPQVAVRVSEIN